jgi:drug/metabolite transporter (DMT)-like permease
MVSDKTVNASAETSPAASRALAFRIGFLLAITNTAIGAAQPVLTRYGALRLDPILFCEGAVIIASLCTLPVLYMRNELRYLVDPRYAGRLFLMAMSGTVATSLTLIYGLRHIDAIAGVILLQTEPVYSLILATAVVGERPTGRQILATITVLAGIGSVFWAGGGTFSPVWAALLIFVTPLFWQTAHVLSLRIMPPLTPVAITAGRFVYAAAVFTPFFLVFDRRSICELADPRLAAVLVLTGFFIYFLSALTWYGAISRLSLSWTTALVVPGVPLLSTLMAVTFLGEHPTARMVIGMLIAIAGVLMLVLGADAHRKHAAPAEAAEAIHQPLS